MALNFGKLNFSVGFNPTSAFPLDVRSYFESYADAVAAAAEAVPAGSSESVYYHGQTLVVVENNKASFYIIQPNNTLTSIEGANQITVNKNLFEFDKDGNLSLKGFDTAALGTVLSVGPQGTLVWSDVYTKRETDDQINKAVAAAAHLKRKIIDSIDSIDINADDADQYIYMVPTGLQEDSNKYYEYMVLILTDSEGTETRFIEQVGSWDVDLSDYATVTQLNTLAETVKFKVDKIDGSRLMTELEGKKLASLENSPIKTINEAHFSIEPIEGRLNLLNLPINKIIGLDDILNNGEKTSGGYYLVSESDKQKLNKLVINEQDGSLEISGSVNASNVQGLAEWITEHSKGEDFVNGLSENNLTDERLNKLESAITEHFIDSVSEDFTVINKKLNLNEISMSKVTNLDLTLKNKLDKEVFIEFETKTNNDISDIQDILTWKELKGI